MAKILTNFLARQSFAVNYEVIKIDYLPNINTFFALDADGNIWKRMPFSISGDSVEYITTTTTSDFQSCSVPNNDIISCIVATTDKLFAFEELNGKVYYTTNGTNWTQVSGVSIENVKHAVFVNNKIIVLADNGTYLECYYSTNNGQSFIEDTNNTLYPTSMAGNFKINTLIDCYTTGSYAFFNTGSLNNEDNALPVKFTFNGNSISLIQTTMASANVPTDCEEGCFTEIFTSGNGTWGIFSYRVQPSLNITSAAYYLDENEWKPVNNITVNSIVEGATTSDFSTYNFAYSSLSEYDNELFLFTKNELFKASGEVETNVLQQTNIYNLTFTLIANSFTKASDNSSITFSLTQYQTFCKYGTYFIFGLNSESTTALKIFVSFMEFTVTLYKRSLGERDFVYPEGSAARYSITLNNTVTLVNGTASTGEHSLNTDAYTFSNLKKGNTTLNLTNNKYVIGGHISDLEDTEYSAYYTPVAYTITYIDRGNTITPASQYQTYTIENTWNLPQFLPARDGYTGYYWCSDSELTTRVDALNHFVGNKIYYAKWILVSYAITYYNANDITGGTLSPLEYDIETATFNLPIVSKYGYTFQGWYDNASLTGTEVTQVTLGSYGNKSFYAKWKINTYSITYDVNPGTNDEDNPVEYNITQLPITIKPPVREYYTFSHWTCVKNDVIVTLLENNNSRVSIDAEDIDLVTNFTLVANWTPITYTIALNADGGTITSGGSEISSISYTIEDSLKLPGDTGGAIITKTNYDFTRWIDTISAETITASSLLAAPRNCTIKAIWVLYSYTITYNFDSGTALDNSYATSYTVENLYIRMPRAVKDGHPLSYYTLAGDENNTYTSIRVSDFVDATTGAAQDLSFTAVYDTDSYVVTYYYFVNVNDVITYLYETSNNISNPNILSYDESTPITLKNPYVAGFTFSKWRKGGTSGSIVGSIFADEQHSYVYYAEFTLKIYDIAYYLNGGVNNVNNVSTYSALNNAILYNPTKTDYTFAGWYDNEAFEGDPISTLVATTYGNVNLYAKWTPTTYTITYDANGGVVVGSNTMTYNCEDIQNLSNAVKNGCTLAGWYIEGSSTIHNTTQNLSGNIILKAKWAEIERSNAGQVNAISYDTALKLIHNELIETMEDNYAYYQDLRVIIANEQEFIKYKQQQPNAVYIVLKYGSASVNFGQSVLPLTMTVIAEQNKIDKIQNLLADFVAKFNLEMSENNTIQQIYETPTVTSNFNKMFEGFRNVMYVSGYLVVSKTANFFTFSYAKDGSLRITNTYLDTAETILEDAINVIVNEDYLAYLAQKPCTYVLEVNSDGENSVNYIVKRYNTSNVLEETFTTTSLNELTQYYGIEVEVTDADGIYAFDYTIKFGYRDIDVITYVFSGNTQLDTQAFYNVKNFTESKARTGTIVLTFTTYLLSSIDIVNDALEVYLKKININRDFNIYINPTFGNSVLETFKLQDCHIQGDIGKIPMITMVFTN